MTLEVNHDFSEVQSHPASTLKKRDLFHSTSNLIHLGENTMQAALRITTKVLPGNKIEIDIPESEIGEDIEVIIMLPDKPKPNQRRALEIFDAAHKLGPFRTPEEIDHDLQAERDSWDS
jgi:hypothetical protein